MTEIVLNGEFYLDLDNKIMGVLEEKLGLAAKLTSKLFLGKNEEVAMGPDAFSIMKNLGTNSYQITRFQPGEKIKIRRLKGFPWSAAFAPMMM
jgi:hypothetical protein